MVEPQQHFFESQRLRLSYWDWGYPERPPLVLVHGGRDHARSWDRVAEAFAADYHVVAPDLRGHGDSAWAVGSQYGIPDNVLDLVRLLEIVGGPAAVVAHSYGGQIALAATATYPELVSTIVAIEGTSSLQPRDHMAGMGPGWLRMWGERVRAFEQPSLRVYATVEEAAQRMLEANPRLPADFLPQLARYAVRPVEGGYVWKFDGWVHGRTSMEIRKQEFPRFWSAIDCPVLLIYGTESQQRAIQGPDDARHFKRARAIEVPEAGHWVHHDQLPLLLREVRAFLASPAS
ncbi:MAG: alpha/beta hydrolase [Dehalococcoidia bacterium]|nr:alpha/beta hydrolase [Dehalococcoidia bacterium]